MNTRDRCVAVGRYRRNWSYHTCVCIRCGCCILYFSHKYLSCLPCPLHPPAHTALSRTSQGASHAECQCAFILAASNLASDLTERLITTHAPWDRASAACFPTALWCWSAWTAVENPPFCPTSFLVMYVTCCHFLLVVAVMDTVAVPMACGDQRVVRHWLRVVCVVSHAAVLVD